MGWLASGPGPVPPAPTRQQSTTGHRVSHQDAGGPRPGRAAAQCRPSARGSQASARWRRAHLRDGVREEAAELLVRAVPHATPPGRVKVLPDAAQTDGHPLAQERVRVVELLQADGDQVSLEAGLLQQGTRHPRHPRPQGRGWLAGTTAPLLRKLPLAADARFSSFQILPVSAPPATVGSTKAPPALGAPFSGRPRHGHSSPQGSRGGHHTHLPRVVAVDDHSEDEGRHGPVLGLEKGSRPGFALSPWWKPIPPLHSRAPLPEPVMSQACKVTRVSSGALGLESPDRKSPCRRAWLCAGRGGANLAGRDMSAVLLRERRAVPPAGSTRPLTPQPRPSPWKHTVLAEHTGGKCVSPTP